MICVGEMQETIVVGKIDCDQFCLKDLIFYPYKDKLTDLVCWLSTIFVIQHVLVLLYNMYLCWRNYSNRVDKTFMIILWRFIKEQKLDLLAYSIEKLIRLKKKKNYKRKSVSLCTGTMYNWCNKAWPGESSKFISLKNIKMFLSQKQTDVGFCSRIKHEIHTQNVPPIALLRKESTI